MRWRSARSPTRSASAGSIRGSLPSSATPLASSKSNKSSAPQEYTYVVYKVTNNTSQDVDFFPTFQIEADDETVTCANVSPKVANVVSERFGRKILDSNKVRGILKPGETRDGIAIFSGVDPASDTLTLYAYGFSGDLKTSRDAEGKVETLYRTYKLVYSRPGDEFVVAIDPVTLKSTEWIWRE